MNPYVIDMHYGIMSGVGWNQNEVNDVVNTTKTTQSVAKGSTEIPVENPSSFNGDQLICFVGSDGKYYSGVIHYIGVSSIFLKMGCPVNIEADSPLYSFYRNDAHPSEFGSYTIIDGSIRQLTHSELHVVTQNSTNWFGISGASVSQDQTFTYNNPGANLHGRYGLVVSCPDVNSGASSAPVYLRGGVYTFSLPINVGQRIGNYSGGVVVSVIETTSGGQDYVVGTQNLYGYNGTKLAKCMFSIRPGSSVSVVVRSLMSGGSYFSLGQLSYFRVKKKITNLDSGKHVLLGDSWVSNDWMTSRLSLALPNSEIIRKGVPGDYMGGLVNRFWTDVAPLNPDFVWVMCGTNDYYRDTSDQFIAELNMIKRNIMMIGAQAIFWNASVGSAYYPVAPFERLTNSRSYAMDVIYHDQTD